MKIGWNDMKRYEVWRGCLAEFVGTTFLILCITCLNIKWDIESTSPSNVEVIAYLIHSFSFPFLSFISFSLLSCFLFSLFSFLFFSFSSISLFQVALGVGFSVTSIAHAFWHVSGGYLNPAVSVAMVAGGRICLVRGFVYIVAQVAGGTTYNLDH